MLTQNDLDEIEKLFDKKLDEKIKFLPTKDEFYEKMDKLIGEIKASREEHSAISGRQSDNSDTLEKHGKRIEKIERILQT